MIKWYEIIRLTASDFEFEVISKIYLLVTSRLEFRFKASVRQNKDRKEMTLTLVLQIVISSISNLNWKLKTTIIEDINFFHIQVKEGSWSPETCMWKNMFSIIVVDNFYFIKYIIKNWGEYSYLLYSLLQTDIPRCCFRKQNTTSYQVQRQNTITRRVSAGKKAIAFFSPLLLL